MISSIMSTDSQRPLGEVTAAPGFAARAADVVSRVSAAEDAAAAVELLHEAKDALGAEHAAFASYIRDDDSKESFRFLVACDPALCLAYQEGGWYAEDAWLLYAATNSEPVCGSQIPLRTRAQQEARATARAHGLASVFVVPAPSSGGLSRLGVLLLGSSRDGYFDCSATASIKVFARSLAMELHEWWVRQIRQELIKANRITPDDLRLLQLERQGLGTKKIADALGVSPSSVDSKFQRLSTKFNMPNRKATARLAAEYGLI